MMGKKLIGIIVLVLIVTSGCVVFSENKNTPPTPISYTNPAVNEEGESNEPFQNQWVPIQNGPYLQGVFEKNGAGDAPEWLVLSYPDWALMEKPPELKAYPNESEYDYLLNPAGGGIEYPYYYFDTDTAILHIYSLDGSEDIFHLVVVDEAHITLDGIPFTRVFAPNQKQDPNTGVVSIGNDETKNPPLNNSTMIAAAGESFPGPGQIRGAFFDLDAWYIFDPMGNVVFSATDDLQVPASGLNANGNPLPWYEWNGDTLTVSSYPKPITRSFEILSDGTDSPAAFRMAGSDYVRRDYPITGYRLEGVYRGKYTSTTPGGFDYQSTASITHVFSFSTDGRVIEQRTGVIYGSENSTPTQGYEDLYGTLYDSVETSSGGGGQQVQAGEYVIVGNQLILTWEDGSEEIMSIALVDLSDRSTPSPDGIIIDGVLLARQT